MRLGLLPGVVSGSGGPSSYVTGVVRALTRVAPDLEVQALLLGAKHLRPAAARERTATALLLGAPGRVRVIARPVSPRLLRFPRVHKLLPYDRLFGRHDVYHQTHLDTDPLVPGDRLVLTLHDLIAEHWPDEGRLLPGAGALLRRAAAVITVSDASRQEILRHFPDIRPERVRVVWNGVDHRMFRPGDDGTDGAHLSSVGFDGPFLLYVGGLTRRKNVDVLLRAHARLRADSAFVPPLLLVGPWDRDRLSLEVAAGQVLPLGRVPSAAVPALMRRASAVVLPSRHEGFGLPLLEAQACGTPVVCSDIGVFREVGGNAPVYVDSRSPETLASGLSVALGMPGSERRERREEGLRHAAGFSWEVSAAGHLQVYEMVAGRTAL